MRTLLHRVVYSTVHTIRSITSKQFAKKSNVSFNYKTLMTLFQYNARDTRGRDISMLAVLGTVIILTNLSNLHISACDQQRIKGEKTCRGYFFRDLTVS